MGMDKKLAKAREEGRKEGFIEGLQSAQNEVQNVWMDGIKVGAEAANEAWIMAVQETKGIGPVLKERIVEVAKRQHDERVAEREKLKEASGQ